MLAHLVHGAVVQHAPAQYKASRGGGNALAGRPAFPTAPSSAVTHCASTEMLPTPVRPTHQPAA